MEVTGIGAGLVVAGTEVTAAVVEVGVEIPSMAVAGLRGLVAQEIIETAVAALGRAGGSTPLVIGASGQTMT